MKRSCVLLLLAASLLLTGCDAADAGSSGTEAEGLMLIRTIGVDVQQAVGLQGPVLLTVGTGVGLNGKPPKILTREDTTVAAAVESLKYNETGLEPFFSHTEQVILGEEAAVRGFSAVMDWMLRAMEIRLDTELYIVRDGSAGELVSCADGEDTAAADMLRLFQETAQVTGNGYVYDCKAVASSLLANGNALIQAVKLNGTEIQSAGFAVICQDALAGYTVPAMTYAVCLLTGKLERYVLQTETGEGEYTLSLKGFETAWKPVFDTEGRLTRMELEIDCTATVAQMEGDGALMEAEVRRRIAEAAEALLERDALSVLEHAAEMNADYLDVGGICRQKAPMQYDRLTADRAWEEIFPELAWEVTARVQVERTYDLIDPVEQEGSH